MATRTRREMDVREIDEFLDSQHTGVLSLADRDSAYGIPLSFHYVPDDAAVYFQFGYGPDSRKRRLVEAVETASFVVYHEVDGNWKSVVMEGPVRAVPESVLDPSVVEALNDLDVPYFQVYHRPKGDMDFGVVRLDVADLSGVAERA